MSSDSKTPAPIKVDTNDLSKDLMSPVSPTTPHSTASAQRAMSTTEAWRPTFDRRQSWSKEEHKHQLQMSKVGDDEALHQIGYGSHTKMHMIGLAVITSGWGDVRGSAKTHG
ncbi:hypothetical protein GQ53DRAFT_835798 [Thozetella sp. PMI_491]|nr:hypothetical protein GQ53DRAFT_835798 [Thozetella sp. PMI_491]